MADLARLGSALAAVLLLAACGSGVPRNGEVRELGRAQREGRDAEIEGGPFVRRVPNRPQAGALPVDVVRGFLDASAVPSDDHAIARSFLVPRSRWNPATGASVYADREIGTPVQRGERVTVAVSFTRTGTVSPAGEFRPAADRSTQQFGLAKVAGEWRLDTVPTGLWLAEKDLRRSGPTYRRVVRYFPDIARRHLVPDPLLLPTDDASLPRVVLRSLLTGPSTWLAPSVRTAIPAGTAVIGAPEVVDGTLNVNFSRELRGAPTEALPVLVAQIVWTLTEAQLEVTGVRIAIEGEQLSVGGRRLSRPQRREDWSDLSPDPTPVDGRPFLVSGGRLVAVDEAGAVTRVWSAAGLESAAPRPSGLGAAGVRRESTTRRALLCGELSLAAPASTRFVAERFSPPTWEPGGTAVWTVASGPDAPEVVVVHPDPDQPAPPAVRAFFPDGTTSVEALRLSRDGARAALIATVGGRRALYQARVEPQTDGSRALTGVRPIGPQLVDVVAVEWADSTSVVVAAGDGRQRGLFRLDFDGFGLFALSTGGLPAPPTGVADAPGLGVLAASGDGVWRRTPAGWERLARGSSPGYAG